MQLALQVAVPARRCRVHVQHALPHLVDGVGYGTDAGSAERVAFGDDAAVAGGLVGYDGAGPAFVGDAITVEADIPRRLIDRFAPERTGQ